MALSVTYSRILCCPSRKKTKQAFLCQPLMDSMNKRPIGVIEFRRNEKIGANQPIVSFSDFEEELSSQISGLIVHSMVIYEIYAQICYYPVCL